MALTTIVLTALAFLAGSFPSGVVLGKLLVGGDVRGFGSGNIGAANAARFGGVKLGAGVGLLDVLKGVAPVLLGRWLGLGDVSLAVIVLAAVLGHDFSIFLQFKGGKGVATTLGAVLALAPLAAILGAATWLLVLGLWGFSSLASLVALALLPFYLGLTGAPPVWVALAFVLFLLAAAKHWPNIVRLTNGTEPVLRRRLLGG